MIAISTGVHGMAKMDPGSGKDDQKRMRTLKVAVPRFLSLGLAFLLAGCRSAAPEGASAAPAVPSPSPSRPTRASIVADLTRVADWQLRNPSTHKPTEWYQ